MTGRKPKPLPRSIRGESRTGEQLKELMKHDTVLVGQVKTLLVGKAMEDESRAKDVIHPSELCKDDWCSRRAFYRITGVEESNPEKFSAVSESLFAEGHFIHEKWQSWTWDLGMLAGEFLCLSCGNLWYDTSPDQCVSCFQPRWGLRYREVPIINKRMRISGRADGRIVSPLIEDHLLEVKSIGPGTFRMLNPELFKRYQDKEITVEDLWKSVRRPFVQHIKQAMFYGWIVDVYKILFVYEWKPYQANKEFVVNVNEDYIEDMIEAAKDLAWALEQDKLPRRPQAAEYVDAKGNHSFCKECAFKDYCWSGNDKATTTTTSQRIIRRR